MILKWHSSKQLEGSIEGTEVVLLRDWRSSCFERQKPTEKLGRQIRCLVSELIVQMPLFWGRFFDHLPFSLTSLSCQTSQVPEWPFKSHSWSWRFLPIGGFLPLLHKLYSLVQEKFQFLQKKFQLHHSSFLLLYMNYKSTKMLCLRQWSK